MAKTNAELVRARRQQLRAQGLRPVQLWLPDTRTPEFAAQVAHDVSVLAKLDPADAATADPWERAGLEGWPEWAGPDFSTPARER